MLRLSFAVGIFVALWLSGSMRTMQDFTIRTTISKGDPVQKAFGILGPPQSAIGSIGSFGAYYQYPERVELQSTPGSGVIEGISIGGRNAQSIRLQLWLIPRHHWRLE